eukprot:gnl/MRDRNA2_/MRDRNA2_73494_c0_seq1.p1 gnl/MRDRNA2_/MRDRNA2_73494_c0~~gnl/MRDRNA2_/MRDRNA2_73494_c0_seq1.p1  ORF type:complete len:326 (-),score=48.27 gnl/MRDRNA2_/MRDRNA2_73494_c0_seq1:35-1012(-)
MAMYCQPFAASLVALLGLFTLSVDAASRTAFRGQSSMAVAARALNTSVHQLHKAEANLSARNHANVIRDVVSNNTASVSNVSCVPPGMRKVSVLNGAFEMVVLGPNDIVSQDIASVGYWEIRDPQEIASVAGGVLPQSGTFLDVGANVGYYSLLFARRGYHVLAVEPMTTNRRAMEASLCLNPDLRQFITIVPVALGSLAETHMVCRVKSTNAQINVGNGYMVCGEIAQKEPCEQNDPLCEMVQVKTIDSVLSEHQIAKLEVVKMDIEGHECEALSGGQSMFQQGYPAFLKMETTIADSSACVHKEATRHGYRTYAMGGDTIMAK